MLPNVMGIVRQSREKTETVGANAAFVTAGSQWPKAIIRTVRQSGVSFDPDVLALLIVAYHAVLTELRLHDHEDAATLMVAKYIIDFAAQGERDPDRLKAVVLEALVG
jgi:hypothetical protein